MHGVLGHYTLDPKNIDEVIRRVADGGVSILQAIPGFLSYAMMDAGHARWTLRSRDSSSR